MYKGLFWLADDKLITYKIECAACGASAVPDLSMAGSCACRPPRC